MELWLVVVLTLLTSGPACWGAALEVDTAGQLRALLRLMLSQQAGRSTDKREEGRGRTRVIPYPRYVLE